MSEENRKKEETMEEPTREMEKETGAETDLPETEPAAEQEEGSSSSKESRACKEDSSTCKGRSKESSRGKRSGSCRRNC